VLAVDVDADVVRVGTKRVGLRADIVRACIVAGIRVVVVVVGNGVAVVGIEAAVEVDGIGVGVGVGIVVGIVAGIGVVGVAADFDFGVESAGVDIGVDVGLDVGLDVGGRIAAVAGVGETGTGTSDYRCCCRYIHSVVVEVLVADRRVRVRVRVKVRVSDRITS
jgi:hypothetical protein